MTQPSRPVSHNEIDSTELRRAFGGFPSGVAALAAVVDGERSVLISSSFTVGVSQEPPLVMSAVQHSSTTWPRLATAERIGVSILGALHAGVVRQLAGKDRARRFDQVATTVREHGSIFFDGSPVWLDCTVEHVYPAGDHDIIVLRVLHLETDFDHAPLLWHRSGFTELV